MKKEIKKRVGKSKAYQAVLSPMSSVVSDPVQSMYRNSRANTKAKESFAIMRDGVRTKYNFNAGFGYFVSPFQKATSFIQVAKLVEAGISCKEVQPLINYLGFNVPEIAKTAAVSASTVSRWKPDSSIGVTGASQFFKIDQIVRKGIALFGGQNEFKSWLSSENRALGNVAPVELITSQVGIDLVDEALDALDYGTFM